MINVSQAVIDCLTERDGDKNIVPRSPESVSCRELEHKLQNVLVFSNAGSRRESIVGKLTRDRLSRLVLVRIP
jgi:hypothetical protein